MNIPTEARANSGRGCKTATPAKAVSIYIYTRYSSCQAPIKFRSNLWANRWGNIAVDRVSGNTKTELVCGFAQ